MSSRQEITVETVQDADSVWQQWRDAHPALLGDTETCYVARVGDRSVFIDSQANSVCSLITDDEDDGGWSQWWPVEAPEDDLEVFVMDYNNPSGAKVTLSVAGVVDTLEWGMRSGMSDSVMEDVWKGHRKGLTNREIDRASEILAHKGL